MALVGKEIVYPCRRLKRPGFSPWVGKIPWRKDRLSSVQFSRSVLSDFFATPWTTACQASLSITNSWSVLKFWVPIPVFIGFPCGSARKESTCNVGDLGSIPGSGRSPGEGNGYPLQYSCLENSTEQRNLVGYSPWGRKALDTTEQLTLLTG